MPSRTCLIVIAAAIGLSACAEQGNYAATDQTVASAYKERGNPPWWEGDVCVTLNPNERRVRTIPSRCPPKG